MCRTGGPTVSAQFCSDLESTESDAPTSSRDVLLMYVTASLCDEGAEFRATRRLTYECAVAQQVSLRVLVFLGKPTDYGEFGVAKFRASVYFCLVRDQGECSEYGDSFSFAAFSQFVFSPFIPDIA